MKIIEGKIYTCDFCGKRQFRQCDMTKHEKWCKENPNNMHKCFQYCKHLVKGKEDYNGGGNDEWQPQRTTFTCALLNKQMFSFKAERRGITKHLDGVERMPLQCDKYDDTNPMYFENDIGNIIDELPY